MTRLTTNNIANPVDQAFWLARILFTIAPILFGLDKFFNILVDWPKYLAPWIPSLIHVSPQAFMYGVGIVEIVAGILVGIWPQFFAYVVTLWLWGIIVNLLTIPGYYDVALRDFGLSLGALALARLAWAHQLERRDHVDTKMLTADHDARASRGMVHPAA
jgi:uncharacterized membrane protein YphA (DoxX/SURF4 family)